MFHMILGTFTSWKKDYVVSKKLLLFGLRNSILWSLFLYLFSSSHDYALFVKNTNVGHVIISLYIDDMVFTNDDIDGILFLKTKLVGQFGLKDLGSL